jgi:hypothetical protein
VKTDDLMDWLARGAGPVGPDPALRRLGLQALLGLGLASALAVGVLSPVSSDLWTQAAFAQKLLVALAAAGCGLAFSVALGRPLTPPARMRLPRGLLGGGVLALALLLVWGLVDVPEGRTASAWFGHSWWFCPLAVLGCALLPLGLLLRRMQQLAPTRLRAAGAAAGLLAGGCGAFGYGLTCNELAPLFVATWYPAGILLSTLLGALLGPKLLRW